MANALIGALRVDLGIDTAQFSAGLANAKRGLAGFASGLAGAAASIGVAMAAVGTALGVAVKGALNEADKLGKLSQSIGIPVEELSRLKHAADLSDVSLEGLSTSVGRLSKNMAAVASGSGDAVAKAFEQLHISVTNSDGSLKSSTAVMTEIADRFAGMEDGAQKTALAIAIFGKAGAQMIPMLNEGSAGLNAMMMEADQLGIVIDTKTAKAAEAFNDNLTRLGAVFHGIVLQITAGMAPGLAKVSDALVTAAKSTDIFKQAGAFLIDAGKVLIEVFVRISGVFQKFSTELRGVGQMIDLFKQGEFSAGWKAYTDAVAESNAELAKADEWLKTLWADAGKGTAPLPVTPEAASAAANQLASVADQAQAATSAAGGALDAARASVSASGAAMATSLRQTALPAFDELRQSSIGLSDTLESSLGQAFDNITEGTFRLRDAIGGLFKDLARAGFSSALRSLFSLGGGAGGGGIFGNLFGGNRGFSGAGTHALGFAHGGSFTVGGAGGIDSQMVAFRASPGEMVDVHTPGSDRGGDPRVLVLRVEEGPMFRTTIRGEADGVAVRRSQQAVASNNQVQRRQQLTAG